MCNLSILIFKIHINKQLKKEIKKKRKKEKKKNKKKKKIKNIYNYKTIWIEVS